MATHAVRKVDGDLKRDILVDIPHFRVYQYFVMAERPNRLAHVLAVQRSGPNWIGSSDLCSLVFSAVVREIMTVGSAIEA